MLCTILRVLSSGKLSYYIFVRLSLSLYHNCDSTTIRRYQDTFYYDESDRSYDMRSIRLRYEKNIMFIFARVEWKQARTMS